MRLDHIEMVWQNMPWEKRHDVRYNMSSLFRDVVVKAEYDDCRHIFFSTTANMESQWGFFTTGDEISSNGEEEEDEGDETWLETP